LSQRGADEIAQRLLDYAQLSKEDIEGKEIDLAPIMARCKEEKKAYRQMIEAKLAELVRRRGGIAAKPRRVKGGIDFSKLPPPQS